MSAVPFWFAWQIAQACGVWLPDLLLSERTLAQQVTPEGHRFRVVQSVGHEGYNTELIYTDPAGRSGSCLVGSQDEFAWRTSLAVSEELRVASVRLGDGRTRAVEW